MRSPPPAYYYLLLVLLGTLPILLTKIWVGYVTEKAKQQQAQKQNNTKHKNGQQGFPRITVYGRWWGIPTRAPLPKQSYPRLIKVSLTV